MTFLPRRPVVLGQANGPDVELTVEGDEWYATYETASGHPAVYDDRLGLFCYARLVDGRFESTGVPVSEPPPTDVAPPHAREEASVREAKVAAKEASRGARAPGSPAKENTSSEDGG
jgi:hypothetical protein